jgi:hypothetical protein
VQLVEPEPAGRDLERAGGHVDADDLVVAVSHEEPQERARAAAEVEHPARPGGLERGADRPEPLVTERDALLEGLLPLVGHVHDVHDVSDPVERGTGQARLVLEVAVRDERLLGVGGQPVAAAVQQLVDLGLVDPVVLVVVEDGQQHVEMGQQVGQPEIARQREADVTAVAPGRVLLVEADRLHVDGVAERLEEPAHEVLAAAGRHRRQPRLERDRRRRQLRVAAALPAHGAFEDRHQGDGHQRRRDVGPVVDVLREREGRRSPSAPHERHGVDLEQQSGRAALRRCLGIDDVRGPERQGEALHAVRVLVQEEAEVGRRPVGRGDGQEHGARRAYRRSPVRLRGLHAGEVAEEHREE